MSIPDFTYLYGGTRDYGFCTNHPGVKAVRTCEQCHAPVCNTCEFVFPGNVQLCPACATTTKRSMSDGRKQMLAFAFIAAVICTVILGASLSGMLIELASDPFGAAVLGNAILFCGLLGLGLSIASLDGKEGNSPLCWVALVWNIIVSATFILLMFVGLSMGA